jgi:hypothetical protein
VTGWLFMFDWIAKQCIGLQNRSATLYSTVLARNAVDTTMKDANRLRLDSTIDTLLVSVFVQRP